MYYHTTNSPIFHNSYIVPPSSSSASIGTSEFVSKHSDSLEEEIKYSSSDIGTSEKIEVSITLKKYKSTVNVLHWIDTMQLIKHKSKPVFEIPYINITVHNQARNFLIVDPIQVAHLFFMRESALNAKDATMAAVKLILENYYDLLKIPRQLTRRILCKDGRNGVTTFLQEQLIELATSQNKENPQFTPINLSKELNILPGMGYIVLLEVNEDLKNSFDLREEEPEE